MPNVCTHAGLSSSDSRLCMPARKPAIPAPRDGDGEREPSGDDGGEAGGAGRREFDRALRPPPPRPDSSM